MNHPLGFRLHGYYRATASTPAIAPAASAILLALRWADPKKLCILERLSASVSVASAVTAQRIDPLYAAVQRAYTLNETTNFNSFLPSGNSNKSFVNFAAPQLAQLCLANAAAGISGGTRVSDAQSFGIYPCPNLAALGSGELKDEFYRYQHGDNFPIILSTNEGVTVSWNSTALATGTVAVSFEVEWAEVE